MMMNAAVDALRSVISHQDAWIRSASYKTEAGESKLFPLFLSGPPGLSFTFSLASCSHPVFHFHAWATVIPRSSYNPKTPKCSKKKKIKLMRKKKEEERIILA